jgi:FKBP-type peptidyl-prolyl cis-trans isomerase FklB
MSITVNLLESRTATFNINQVVPGWTESLKLMPVGSKWIVTIPANLGYGAPGAPPRIPPNSVLIFEIELISVSNSPAPPKNP